ncbi:MAG: hypothetical protein PUD93_05065 [Lachnospiraceae bacterium]|nr:hypothetical protein [Lachnospiraceae bacterium]
MCACGKSAVAERDGEETYRTWLLSSASEPTGQVATGSACYSGRVSFGTCRDYLREKMMKRSGNAVNIRLLIFSKIWEGGFYFSGNYVVQC